MDAEGKDNDVSFAQRKDQEDVSVSLLQEFFFCNPWYAITSVYMYMYLA